MSLTRTFVVGRCGLAALLLLADGHGLALRHTHADGQSPHRHDAVDRDIHELQDHDHAHDQPASGELSGTCRHVHFWLFGFELPSLPIPADDPTSADELGPQLVAASAAAGPAMHQAGREKFSQEFRLTASAAVIVLRPLEPHRAAQSAVAVAMPAPLCDAARHERSGVQLI